MPQVLEPRKRFVLRALQATMLEGLAGTSPPPALESESALDAYLRDCRALTLRELGRIVPTSQRYASILYDLALEYPQRASKALRPALCMATCRALGGPLQGVLRSAAVLELYHSAFLIHDDVEDGSELRRDRPTLHVTHGVPIAVNVGDAMLALALEPLLDNMTRLGLGKALRILRVVARMARESAEGQALELDWVRTRRWDLGDADYLRMVHKKTGWYTFVAPVVIGGIVAGAGERELAALRRFAALLGLAFQIQDDVLNLVAERAAYGKEIAGDLWEGKHTLILMHAFRAARPSERARMAAILEKARPGTTRGRTPRKSARDVDYLLRMIHRHDSIAHARRIAREYARRAATALERADWLPPSVHREFLADLVAFVVERDR